MEFNYQLFIVLSLIFIIKFKYWQSPLLIAALFSALFPFVLNDYFAPSAQKLALFTLSADSWKALVVLSISLLVPSKIFNRPTISFIHHIALLDCAYVLYRYLHFHNNTNYAMGLCPTMDGAFISLMYAYTVKFSLDLFDTHVPSQYILNYYKTLASLVYLLIPPICIFLTGGATGAGVLGLTILILTLHHTNAFKSIKPRLIHISALLIPAIILYTANKFSPIMRDHHRLPYWLNFLDFWHLHANPWFGFGLGTFQSLGPYSSMAAKLPEIFLDAHNDWLQCLFELGIVGLSASILFISYIIYRSRHNIYLLTSTLTYSIAAFFYYPIHNPILGVYAIILIKEALSIPNKLDTSNNDIQYW